MEYADTTFEDDYTLPTHSGLGIASLVIVLAAGLIEVVAIVTAGVLESTTPGGLDETSPVAMLVGLTIFGGIFLALVGIGLGIAGLCQTNRKKLFAIIGVAIGASMVLGVILLIAVGLAVG